MAHSSLVLTAVFILGATVAPLSAQEPECWLRGETTMEEAAQRPSPLGETVITLGDGVGKVCYGRPSARGRPVAGNLIPFGEPWRMGANEATVLHLPVPARVGGVELPAGSYSLYTIAQESEWEIVVNQLPERWGIPINDQVRGADLDTLTVPVRATPDMVEQLTFTWEAESPNAGILVVEWERSRVEIPVEAAGN